MDSINSIRRRLSKEFNSSEIHLSEREMAEKLQMRNVVPLNSEGNWVIGVKIFIDGEHKLDVGGNLV